MNTIARATERDFAEASHILTAYFDAIELSPAHRDGPEDILAYLHEPGGMWIARHGGQAVGVIALRPLTTIAGACEIKRLYVDRAHRGHGIADALLDAAEGAAIARGYTVAYLDTRADLQAAIAFYQRRGYETCERYNDNPVASVFMRFRFASATPADRHEKSE
jgi:ribosomal protein S18 acetylase RimI-like enzyme